MPFDNPATGASTQIRGSDNSYIANRERNESYNRA